MQAHRSDIIKVSAPGRLHLGFLDLHGGLNRLFGSLGVGLADISTDIEARHNDKLLVSGPGATRAHRYANELLMHMNIQNGVRIHINRAIPEHAGLGSGTQMALAVGEAINRLFELELSLASIATILDRGNRSGIGIGSFASGGFIVDAGRSAETEVPPVISRLHFPDSWRFVLVLDPNQQGVHGKKETQAFVELEKMDESLSGHLCRLLLMQVLPAVVEQNCSSFGKAVTEIQVAMGEYFSSTQSGIYTSADVGQALFQLQEQGASGIGQSSWGPTGFAVFASETDAYQAVKKVRKHWRWKSELELMICSAKNDKAEIVVDKVNNENSERVNKGA